MGSVSLNSSLRSNLLSLQQTAKLQELTQNRLSTGLRVNSAIDNPSSYYIAAALNNRASDLSALLDAMSQGIQTLKAAQQGLQTASTFLEQAASIANQALETEPIPAKEWFEQQNNVAAVVTNETELLNAVNSDIKGDIVVYGRIEMTRVINLKAGQNILGVGYYEGVNDKTTEKFSQLSWNINRGTPFFGINISGNSTIADLSLKMSNNNGGAIVLGNSFKINVQNLDVDITYNKNPVSSGGYALPLFRNAIAEVSGRLDIMACNYSLPNYMDVGELAVDSEILFKKDSIFNYFTEDKGTTNQNMLSHRSLIEVEQGATLYLNEDKYYCKNKFSIQGNLSILNNFRTPDFEITNGEKAEEGNHILGLISFPFQSYKNLLNQFDAVLQDSGYNGVNLLAGNDLKINFNVEHSSSLLIKGKDLSTKTLGVISTEWKKDADLKKSISELEAAINQIRAIEQEFGTHFSIVNTREDFTNKLINVLTEGADKLTLADMNEESANSLMLETRQNLAINALSLASQASQKALRLF